MLETNECCKTAIYIVSFSSFNHYKVGFHTGNQKALISRYNPVGDVEILQFYRSPNALYIEQQFHGAMHQYAMKRRVTHMKGKSTEAYICPYHLLLEQLIPLIAKDYELLINAPLGKNTETMLLRAEEKGPSGQKECTKCKVTKPLSEFRKHANQCKFCRSNKHTEEIIIAKKNILHRFIDWFKK